MEGVLLTWNNLDDEAKENLKGDKGDAGVQGPQGIPGAPGENGKVLYTWIRYADNNQGAGISNDPTGKTYIGFAYNKETAIESNNPSEYAWSGIKGEQGVPGKTGIDGKTYYTWIAYSDNANGSNMYQQPTDNTMYIGIAVNRDTAVESNNPSDYTWSKFRGESGMNGIDGANGINGADGISMIYKGEYPSHPSNPLNGWYYRNTTDKKSYVCHDNAWYVMTIDGANGKDGLDGKDGISITWKGDLATPPVNPQKNWTYRDMDNGRVYIYNGIAWELMVADGNDGIDGTTGQSGSDGKGVYITYHDSESEPDKPTGDGTTGGWHTNSTATVIWISQKVADNASSGVWGDPIRIKGDVGNPGQDANLLPWVEQWEKNKTQIGSEYVVSPKIFSGINSGTADDPVLTGIAIGEECITDKDGNKRTGIFALVDNEPVFELDPISKKYKFEGEVNATSGKFEGITVTEATITKCKIEDVFTQGSIKITSVMSSKYSLNSNFVVFEVNSVVRPLLDIRTKDYGGIKLTLNAPTEFKLINLSNLVIGVGFYSNSGQSICKAYNGFTWDSNGLQANSANTVDFNYISLPIGWVCKLIFIPVGTAAGSYIGNWYLVDSNNYQLYYHPSVIESYKYEMVPLLPNSMITK